jgi:hypothetical protein
MFLSLASIRFFLAWCGVLHRQRRATGSCALHASHIILFTRLKQLVGVVSVRRLAWVFIYLNGGSSEMLCSMEPGRTPVPLIIIFLILNYSLPASIINFEIETIVN